MHLHRVKVVEEQHHVAFAFLSGSQEFVGEGAREGVRFGAAFGQEVEHRTAELGDRLAERRVQIRRERTYVAIGFIQRDPSGVGPAALGPNAQNRSLPEAGAAGQGRQRVVAQRLGVVLTARPPSKAGE